MRVIEGSTRVAFLCFFLSHIPITLLVDGQGLFGPFYPRILTDVVAWYSSLSGDVVMKHAPSADYAWFSSLIVCEILFQLPFFVVVSKQMLAAGSETNRNSDANITNENDNDNDNDNKPSSRLSGHYPEWFRIACIIYGSHVSTTLVPILAMFLASREMTAVQKCATTAIYSPYLIFPLWLLWLAARESFVDMKTESKLESKKTE